MKQVIDREAVLLALKNNNGYAFEELKKEFMALVVSVALEQNAWNVSKTSDNLGIARNTIYKFKK